MHRFIESKSRGVNFNSGIFHFSRCRKGELILIILSKGITHLVGIELSEIGNVFEQNEIIFLSFHSITKYVYFLLKHSDVKMIPQRLMNGRSIMKRDSEGRKF